MPSARAALSRKAQPPRGATRACTRRLSCRGYSRRAQKKTGDVPRLQQPCILSASKHPTRHITAPIRPIRPVHSPRTQHSSVAHSQPLEQGITQSSDEADISDAASLAVLGSFWQNLWAQCRRAVQEAGPLALLMCLLTVGNANFDQAKDVMVLNLLGAKYIPFFQVYAVLPLSIGFLWGYQLVQRILPRRGLFPVIISIFVFIKLLAAHVFLPHALSTISAAPAAPAGLGFWAGLMANAKLFIIPAAFYGFCELYGDVVLGVLFWGFAIQSTASKHAKRLLPLYCVGANLAQILVGFILQQVSRMIPGAMDQIQALCGIGAVACLLAVFLYEALSRTPSALAAAAEVAKAPKSEVKKPNPLTAFMYCKENVDIRPLAIMAVSSGVASNVLEFAWKLHLSKWLTTPEMITGFMANVAMCAGVATLCLIPLSSIAFQRIGWSKTAKATPNLLLAAGLPFFLACITYHWLKHSNTFMLFQDPLLMGISVSGAALYVGFRSAKFALYKPAEEMVYKNLDERAQTEGKAAVDVVAAQFGKTGSSLFTQFMLVALPWISMVGAMGTLSCAFMLVGTVWRDCLTSLSGKMDEIKLVEPVTAAQLAQDAAGWGTKKATDWGERATGNGIATGEWGTIPDGGTRGSRQIWGSDDRPRPSGVRCGALDPVLA